MWLHRETELEMESWHGLVSQAKPGNLPLIASIRQRTIVLKAWMWRRRLDCHTQELFQLALPSSQQLREMEHRLFLRCLLERTETMPTEDNTLKYEQSIPNHGHLRVHCSQLSRKVDATDWDRWALSYQVFCKYSTSWKYTYLNEDTPGPISLESMQHAISCPHPRRHALWGFQSS